MQIQLTTPCSVSAGELKQIKGGHYCGSCQKTVTDYSNMTDAEILAFITKNGVGCGQFRKEQLDRDLNNTERRKKKTMLFYLLFFAAMFTRQPSATAQQKQDTIHVVGANQIDISIFGASVYEPPSTELPLRVFGTGNIVTTRRYKKVSLFWGLITFKIKAK